MLWYKAWLETRSRFLIALVGSIALCSRLVVVFLRVESPRQAGQVLHAAHETLATVWLLALILLMMGGLLREKAVGSFSFTLSLPVSRLRLMSVRIAMGVMEAIALAILPWMAMLLSAKVAGQPHFIAQAGFHILLLLSGGMLFLAASLLISSLVEGEYTAPLVSCGAIIMLIYAMSGDKLRPYSPWVFMLGDEYFHWRTSDFVGQVPWLRAAAFLAIAALLIMISVKVVQRRDFT
jgi:ABC-2 type transport system permease protein